ncbi:N-acetylmuramoyl-L-alanine amidase [bacterium]|nr:N-acetylmuramoyl-L-alanine amidase [bacterium]
MRTESLLKITRPSGHPGQNRSGQTAKESLKLPVFKEIPWPLRFRGMTLALIISIICLLTILPFSAPAQQQGRRIVVLDPGHGGKDNGVQIKGLLPEKELVFKLAKEVKLALQSQPGIAVFLTRKNDIGISILERTTFANRRSADVFISLHLAGPRSGEASGRPYFYINRFVKDPELSRIVEQKVQAGINVLPWDLAQNRMLSESRGLGRQLLKTWQRMDPEAFSEKGNLEVVRAPVAILSGVRSAAILIEFPAIPKKKSSGLENDAYCRKAAGILAKGIRNYFSGR